MSSMIHIRPQDRIYLVLTLFHGSVIMVNVTFVSLSQIQYIFYLLLKVDDKPILTFEKKEEGKVMTAYYVEHNFKCWAE